jgi:peroxiredoxin (alkyl hydroperoxide reductase subunit C)
MARVGEKAPEWRSPAYRAGEEVEIASQDLTGSWYVLFWYPMDFTFVCPTELNGFQKLVYDFEDDGVVLIGASTDSYFSHRAWFQDRGTFPRKITYPVLADTSQQVSRAFGVLKEDEGVAYRAVAVVDDQGVVRSLSVNDLEVGRNPAEILRTAQALLSGGLCGANWKKGDPFAG